MAFDARCDTATFRRVPALSPGALAAASSVAGRIRSALRGFLPILLCALSLSVASSTRAQDDSLRLVVRLQSPQDRMLLEHLRGQLSDVPAEIVPVTSEREQGPAFSAEQLARSQTADAVLWFEPGARSSELVVQLWAADSGARPARSIAAQASRGAGMLETAALIARSSITALLRARSAEGALTASHTGRRPNPTPPTATLVSSARSPSARSSAALQATLASEAAATPQRAAPGARSNAALQPTVASERAASVAERPANAPAERPANVPAERPANEPAERPANAPAERPANVPAERSANAPAERPANAPAERTAVALAASPAATPLARPTASVAEHAAAKRGGSSGASDEARVQTSSRSAPASASHELASAPSESVAAHADSSSELGSGQGARDSDAQGDRAGVFGSTLLVPSFFVGVQSVLDGVSEVGQHALALRFGVALRSFGLSVFGSASMGSSVSDRWVDLHLSRHNAGVALDFQGRIWGDWHGAAGVHAGVVLYQRSSVPKLAGVDGTGSAVLAIAAFGPELALQYRPTWFGIGLRAALDVLPNAASFQLAAQQGRAPAAHALWAFEPRLGLGLEGNL